MPTYTTTSGHVITYERTPAVDAFLLRLEEIVDDPKATSADATELAYSSDNPILDHTMFANRGAVTREVMMNPVYEVVSDLVFRKELARSGTPLSAIAARYTMNVRDAAATLAITEAELRSALAANRIGSWMKNGEHFFDPRSLEAVREFGLLKPPKAKPVDRTLTTLASRMNVCPDCGELHGPFTDAKHDGAQRVQRCGCDALKNRRPDDARWHDYDFNRAVELCQCCAAALIASGSKWSPFFCDACKRNVDVWNARGRRIPLGRHSLANGILLTPRGGRQKDTDPEVRRFESELRELFDRIDRLHDWRAERVASLRRWTGYPTSVPEYLAATASESARREAVLALAEQFPASGERGTR